MDVKGGSSTWLLFICNCENSFQRKTISCSMGNCKDINNVQGFLSIEIAILVVNLYALWLWFAIIHEKTRKLFMKIWMPNEYMGFLNLVKYIRFINVGFQENATWFMSHEIVVWSMIHRHSQTCEHALDHKWVMQWYDIWNYASWKSSYMVL